MRIQLAFLQSKVARRIFGLFVLSALLPILLTTYLSYDQVRDLIEKDRIIQLSRESKLLSMVTYERLLNIAYRLNTLPKNIETENSLNADSLFSEFSISAVYLEADSGRVKNLYGNAPAIEYTELLPLKSQINKLHLRIGYGKGQAQAIFLLKSVVSDNGRLSYIIINVEPEYLWPHEYASYGIYGIVYDNEGNLLHCDIRLPNNFPDKALFEAISEGKREFSRGTEREEYYLANKDLFMEGDFDTSDWLFASLQPKAISLLDLRKFGRYFIPPILLSICLISIVSLVSIRRNLVPIDKLLEGTQKIGEKEFSHQILLKGNDEFSKLASSFNQMTRSLKTQFDIYDNLSGIDQLILRSAPAENIIETVLDGFKRLAESDYVFLILLENNSSQLYQAQDEDGSITMQRIEEPLDDVLDIDWSIEGREAGDVWWLKHLDKQTESESNVFNIFELSIEGKIFGAVALGNSIRKTYSESQYSIFKDYASRIAIAIAALRTREQLQLFATIDSLTNIPNRRQMKILTDAAVSKISETGGVGAFLFIDLDHFKNVNDAHGHKRGDELLVAVAKRLSTCVQKEYTAARLGGDEFAILIPCAENLEDVKVFARYIIENLSRRYVVDNVVMYVGASIGIALFPEHGRNSDELLQNADIALYKAKNNGRGTAFIYSATMGEERVRRTELETDIREALKNNEFELYYQPKVDVKTGVIKGFEVLLRWQHKVKGFISPLTIVTIAEESGLIIELDNWVFRNACEQIAKWQQMMPEPLTFSINISAKRLMDKDFIPTLKSLLADTSLPPELLEIEITETVLMEDLGATLHVLEEVHKLNMKVALDDFGTGYSSLSYLSTLPIDTLKIDRAFVNAIGKSGQEGAVVNAMIALAHSLEMAIVAEGIETAEQLHFFYERTEGQVQGYYFSKAVSEQQATNLVQNPKTFTDQLFKAVNKQA